MLRPIQTVPKLTSGRAQSDWSVLECRHDPRLPHPHGLACGPSGAVVLHVSDDGLPTLSVPSVHMTAVRSGPIAVPDLSHLCRACLERGEATLTRHGWRSTNRPYALAPINLVGPRHTAVLHSTLTY